MHELLRHADMYCAKYMGNETDMSVSPSNPHQAKEVRDARWMKYHEVLNNVRDTHTQRREPRQQGETIR
jgi:NADH pyrophosphatase NudC (nudix superfamily)